MLLPVFWLLLILAIYSYFLYPIILKVLKPRGNASADSDGDTPKLSLIITAYNEEQRIEEKLENALEADFDPEYMEIIVASDCSEDATDDIVRSFSGRGVKLVRAGERLGKENAQWEAIQKAEGDILVFSDVATKIPKEALRQLTVYFADQNVGAVSSEDRFITSDGSTVGEGAYVRYEMWLRKQESRLAGLVGLSGSFFAARKSICLDWDIHSPSDFNTALNCAKAGLVAVTAPDVLGYYQDLKDETKEYQRKIRTVIRGITALSRHPEVLNPFKFGLFAFQVISHKLMRWLVPWFLIALLIVSALVSHHGFFYQLVLLAQLVFYGLALAAHYSERLRNQSVIKLIYFFVQVNLALFDAGCRFLAGKRMTVWQPSAR